MELLFLFIGILVGGALVFFWQKGRKVTREAYDTLKEEKMALEYEHQHLKEKGEERQQELEQTKKELQHEFRNLADQLMEKHGKQFKEQNKEQLDALLNPLNKDIKAFREKVEKAYHEEARERHSLKNEVKNLMEASQEVRREANDLAGALKGSSNSKMQGDWGETILRRILENSDLREGHEYHLQRFLEDKEGNKVRNEEGKRLQPDVVIEYPDDRKIIIDAKVSLTAYVQYTTAEDEESRQQYLRQHMSSLKGHIDALSEKHYQDHARSLDFVMLFIPNEASFSTAIENDPALWEYAYRKRVVLITPTNLIATLKLISDLWKREYQNQNAEKIAERGQKLYDKFVNFVSSLREVGDRLDKTQNTYDQAWNQLTGGKGNLVKQAEDLKALGVKPKKDLPEGMKGQQKGDEPEDPAPPSS